ncbi:heme oxygenase [Luteibacter sp. W1I16]|uniref:biliverdin-producing heme oxygenase n=1 Tax=Luteibacter sp. W1I16 TaxID=3373922 RepID=UPI003D194E27
MDGACAVARPAHLLLREATRAAHDAAEASPRMRRLLAGDMDEADYRRLLLAQWPLFSEWEAERRQWLAETAAASGWVYVSRAERLAEDLFDAGAAIAASAAIAPPGKPNATAWGELYVIEGSALGGRLIARHLRERFPHLPHRFYTVGEQLTAPWRSFQAILDEALTGEAARRDAVDGARRMFARFQHVLQDDATHG